MRKILLMATLLACAVLSSAAPKGVAKLKFAETMYNFGSVSEAAGAVSHDFTFTNTGDAPLVIFEVNTNCGCTTADVPQAPIAPGKSGVISITFHPEGNPGEFAKEIVVKSNAQKKKTRLHIKGVVFPKQ